MAAVGRWSPPPRGYWPVGDVLRDWCRRHKVSHGWLAVQADISEKHLSQIMTGNSMMSVNLAIRLGDVTGIPATRLYRLQSDRLIQMLISGERT